MAAASLSVLASYPIGQSKQSSLSEPQLDNELAKLRAEKLRADRLEIAEWNKAVEARKAAKRARKA